MMGMAGPMGIVRSSLRLSGLCLNVNRLIGQIKKLTGDMRSPGYLRQLAMLNHHCASGICRSHGLRIHVKGSASDYPAVYVANHLGYIDPFLIVSQSHMLPVAKLETAGWPILGSAMKACGVLFVKRDDPFSGARLLREAVRVLKAGVSILNFPEGTTTCGDTVLPFKRGLFGIARLADVPVVPVCIEYMDSSLAWCGDTLFFPHYLKTSAKKYTDVHLSFGDPVFPRAFEDAETLAEQCRSVILRQINEGRSGDVIQRMPQNLTKRHHCLLAG